MCQLDTLDTTTGQLVVRSRMLPQVAFSLPQGSGDSLKFKQSTLMKQGRELVYTHDTRGKIFRVAVNKIHQGKLEYSAIHVCNVLREDIDHWYKAKEILSRKNSGVKSQNKKLDSVRLMDE